MATEEKQSTEQTETSDEHTSTENTSAENTDAGGDEREMTEKPEVTDEHKEVAREMAKAYEDDRPTVALPGSGNTVTGQAVNNWLDDDGKPKHGEVENEVERQG